MPDSISLGGGSAAQSSWETDVRTLFTTALLALCLSAVPDFAGDSGDLPATTTFTLTQQAQPLAKPRMTSEARQSVGSTAVYPVQSHELGTWFFEPNATGGGSR